MYTSITLASYNVEHLTLSIFPFRIESTIQNPIERNLIYQQSYIGTLK